MRTKALESGPLTFNKVFYMEKKIGRPAPDWLRNLKPGKYTAKDLEQLTGINNRSIRNTMTRHGAKISYEFNGKAIEGVFEWDGFQNKK